MSQIEFVFLAILLAAAVYLDLASRRIPNAVIAIGILAALVFGYMDGNLMTRVAGFGVGLLIFIPFFALRLVGAGDTKLMAMVGAFTGASALLPISIYTFIVGGLLGIATLVVSRSGSQALQNLRLVLFVVVARSAGTGPSLGDLGLKSAARIPYAVAIAAGVVCWKVVGGWPA